MKILEKTGCAGFVALLVGVTAKHCDFPQIAFWASISTMVLSWIYVWHERREYVEKATKAPSDLLISVAAPTIFFIGGFVLSIAH